MHAPYCTPQADTEQYLDLWHQFMTVPYDTSTIPRADANCEPYSPIIKEPSPSLPLSTDFRLSQVIETLQSLYDDPESSSSSLDSLSDLYEDLTGLPDVKDRVSTLPYAVCPSLIYSGEAAVDPRIITPDLSCLVLDDVSDSPRITTPSSPIPELGNKLSSSTSYNQLEEDATGTAAVHKQQSPSPELVDEPLPPFSSSPSPSLSLPSLPASENPSVKLGPFDYGSEVDAEWEHDDGSDDPADDDYNDVPSSRRCISSPRRSKPSSMASSRASLRSVSKKHSSKPNRRVSLKAKVLKKRHDIQQPSKPRAYQVPDGTPFSVPNDYKCRWCRHRQANLRRIDFKRHVETHYRTDVYWTCAGLPVRDVTKLRITDTMRIDTLRVIDGTKMIGGCGKVFGRKDAYIRHLKSKSGCIGDVAHKCHPGNLYDDA